MDAMDLASWTASTAPSMQPRTNLEFVNAIDTGLVLTVRHIYTLVNATLCVTGAEGTVQISARTVSSMPSWMHLVTVSVKLVGAEINVVLTISWDHVILHASIDLGLMPLTV